MNFKMIGRISSLIYGIEAVFMLPALILALQWRETGAALAFALTECVLLVCTSGLFALCRKASKGFFAREGMVTVGWSWITLSLFGCLPFWFSGEIPTFTDAMFETASGFTTTGASILANVEVMSRSLLYWRSFSHWLGGMGVLVFMLAVLPLAGRGNGFTVHLLRAESTGPDVGKLVPRMRDTALILYATYILLTLADFGFLVAGGMPVFDSVCTAMGTAGTGGFGVRADSLASYSPYLQNVTTVFMLLFGVNFNMYYLLSIRKFSGVWRDEELRLYLIIVAVSTVLIAINIRGFYNDVGDTLRHSAFQVSSIITTTGFATADFDQWPSFSKAILLLLMAVGACAGSTGGGMKVSRVILSVKSLIRGLADYIHPRDVRAVRISGHVVEEKVLARLNAYLCAYVLIIVVSFLIVSLDGFSTTTNFSAVLACANNIGPGLEAVGPAMNFSAYSPLAKWVLIIDMLAGRLEIFPILLLFAPSTWRK